jgi:hypothetical protein
MQPYEKRDDYLDSGTGLTTDSDSGSESDTESTTSSESESENQDRRMQADQDWRTAQQSWIAAPGRTTTTVMPNTILPLRSPPPTSVIDLPTELRASDIKRHIVNIDSQFRETPDLSTPSDFYFRILTTVRNVLRVRVTSIEFPNNYPFFTAVRRSIQFVLDVSAGGPPGSTGTNTITIPEGNYGAADMEDILNAEFAAYSITVTWNETRGRFTFQNASGSSPFGFSINTSQPTTGTYARPIAYGLGYYLGFTRGVHTAAQLAPGGPYILVSNVCANFAGDRYVFLKVNDFDCVTQTTEENDFTALAKVVLREPKNYMAFDDYASQHIKEVVFHNPRDLTRFHVRVLDPWGDPVDLCSAEFSFSLELLEVKNHSLFNAMRDSIATKYV